MARRTDLLASKYTTTYAKSKRYADQPSDKASERGSNESTASGESTRQSVETASVHCRESPERDSSDERTLRADGCENSSDAGDTAQSWAWNFDTERPCAECDAREYARSQSGEWYCQECGAVQTRGDVKQRDPGWISEEERRSGPSTGPSEIQIGSSVGAPWRNEGGRWAKYNERLSYQNKRLRHGLKEIRALTTALEVTDSTREDAAVRFRKTATEGLLKGRSIESVAAACVYIAARQNRQPVTFTWLAEVSPVSESDISNAYRKLVSEFELGMNVPVPENFVDRIGSEVSLSLHRRERAHEILQAVTDAGEHIGQSPPGMAAAALYGAAMEAKIEITQAEVAEAAGVSVVTLSRQWQTIKSVLEEMQV